MYSANYNAFSFSDPMLGLNTAFESIGGPVNIDWMLRSAGGGLGVEPYAYLRRLFAELPKAKTVEDFEAMLPFNTALT